MLAHAVSSGRALPWRGCGSHSPGPTHGGIRRVLSRCYFGVTTSRFVPAPREWVLPASVPAIAVSREAEVAAASSGGGVECPRQVETAFENLGRRKASEVFAGQATAGVGSAPVRRTASIAATGDVKRAVNVRTPWWPHERST